MEFREKERLQKTSKSRVIRWHGNGRIPQFLPQLQLRYWIHYPNISQNHHPTKHSYAKHQLKLVLQCVQDLNPLQVNHLPFHSHHRPYFPHFRVQVDQNVHHPNLCVRPSSLEPGILKERRLLWKNRGETSRKNIPEKFNIDTKHVQRSHLFQTIIWGIHLCFPKISLVK